MVIDSILLKRWPLGQWEKYPVVLSIKEKIGNIKIPPTDAGGLFIMFSANKFACDLLINKIFCKYLGHSIHMELMAGFEPATCALRVRCSTTEPHQLALLFYNV